MQITKEWLENEAVLLNDQGSLLISPRQTELLYEWFPDLFKPGEKSFVKHWNKKLCEKEIDSHQKTLFKKAKMKEAEVPSVVSENIKAAIDKGMEAFRMEYKAEPTRPQLRFVSLIGHTPKVKIQEVSFSAAPEYNTVVRFTLNVRGKIRNLQGFCSGSNFILIDNKKAPLTKIYEELGSANGSYYLNEIKDCTGLDIVETLNSFQVENVFIEPKVYVKENTSKRSIEDIQKQFMKDFDKINSKRKEFNLPDLSLLDFATKLNVNFTDESTLRNYADMCINLNDFLK